jgi:catechol 2,3-dioxygenase
MNLVGQEGQYFLQKINMLAAGSPPRFLVVIDSSGRSHSGKEPLDVDAEIGAFDPATVMAPPIELRIGHVHLHVRDLAEGYAFYGRLGLERGQLFAEMGFGDLAFGGPFKHRVAVNVWQGQGAPPPPAGVARLRHFDLRFDSAARLDAALAVVPHQPAGPGIHLVTDPSGNSFHLSAVKE